MNKTKIEWCDSTLNPVVGCTFGCPYCYARKMNERFDWIPDFSDPQFFPERLKQLNSKKPLNIFMNSMSDIADWQEGWIKEIAGAMNSNPQHNYLFLTKRPDEIRYKIPKFLPILGNSNVWLGITVTNNEDMKERISDFTWLKRRYELPCHLFISFEPLHEHIRDDLLYHYIETRLQLEHIDWIIVGAETGNRKEKIIPKPFWTNNILFYAKTRTPSKIPVFMKESMVSIVEEKNMLREFPNLLVNNTDGIDSKEGTE